MWDRQYSNNEWHRLHHTEEVAHYAVIAGLLYRLGANHAILDVGCGTGNLVEYLRAFEYDSYVGIDFSEQAIRRCTELGDENTSFITSNIEEYMPSAVFDAIIFNECLYYVPNPVEIVQTYSRYLSSSGVLAISVFTSSGGSWIVHEAAKKLATVETVEVKNNRGTWICGFFLSPCRTSG
jgi:2-polyprenyl-3-methyl-5-hydroxy-6-metoxy-1,4-benzoquinol methylase